jgi:mono/diheme cytochrome c family protein
MDRGDAIAIALVLLGPAAILWWVFLNRSRRPRRPASVLGIPQAMRPGQPDEALEGRRLERIQVAGVLFSIATALFIVAYWFPETQRQEAFAERFDEESLERGELIFNAPPPLEEDADPAAFREEERAIALGQACVNCHGAEGVGGKVPNGFIDPVTGRRVEYVAPPLNNVFTRWDDEVVRFTIERGRPGTPMPAWGVEYGGSMTSQMVSDVMNWLKTLPGNNQPPGGISEECEDPDPIGGQNTVSCGQEIFEARCAVCHGEQGQGKDTDTYHQGMALWKGKVEHLDLGQHIFTVVNGRRFAFMPAFGEAPAQGIPVPRYPLSDSQIRAVVEYERTL